MPSFAFQARDRGGQTITGTREAPDQRAALDALREAGLFVTDLSPTRGGRSSAPASETTSQSTSHRAEVAPAMFPEVAPVAVEQVAVEQSATAAPVLPPHVGVPRPVTPSSAGVANPNQNAAFAAALEAKKIDWTARANSKQVSLYFRQIYSMLHAGTSIAQALAVLGQHETNPALRRASHDMHLRTSRGVPLSETMSSYQGLFSEMMIGMIGAGEQGGFIDGVCLRVSEWAERDYQIQQTIKRETWYPKLLVFCSFLIPSVVPLFLGGFNAWLKFVVPPFLLISALWIGWKIVAYFLPLSNHARPWRKTVDSIKLLIPVVGKTVRGFAVSKFCRALSATYASGMAPHRAVRVAADACGNVAIADSVMQIVPRLERGDPMTDALASTKNFQPVVLQMLRTGEESGKIDAQLDNVADFLETDAETATKQAVKVFGILVFLCIAVYIASQIIGGYVGHVDQAMEIMNTQ